VPISPAHLRASQLLDDVVEEDRGQREDAGQDGHHPCHQRPNIGENLHDVIMAEGTDTIYGDLPLSHP